jgi:hypothetical protein
MNANVWVVDAALWSAVVALTAMALWLSRPVPRAWDPARMFAVCRSILSGQPAEDALNHPRARVGVACTDMALQNWHHSNSPNSGADGVDGVARAVGRHAATLLWWGAPSLLLPTAKRTPGWETVEVGTTAGPQLEATLEALLADKARRFVVLISEEPAAFFAFFADVPGLRDRTRAVVLAAADPGPDTAWIASTFRHEKLDLEMDHALPYLTLRTGSEVQLRTPAPEPTGRDSIEVIDLGVYIPVASITAPSSADEATGAALLLVLAALG